MALIVVSPVSTSSPLSTSSPTTSKIVPTKGNLIYLNVSPAKAFRRVVNNRVKTERFETIEELSKMANKALDLVSDGKWVIVDGNRSISEIHVDILRAAGVK